MATTVIHIKDSKKTSKEVFIGRGGKWGNPFKIGPDGTREEVIAKFREWVVQQPELMGSLGELKDKVLVCFCKPQGCHGDVLAELADAYNPEERYIIAGTGSRSLQLAPRDIKQEVMDKLIAHLTKAKEAHENLWVMSGMAEGFDNALATAALRLEIPLWAAIPNPTYGRYYWGRQSLTGKDQEAKFRSLRDRAQEVTYVCDDIWGPNGVHSNFIRNEFMVTKADEFLVLGPQSRGTAHCFGLLKDAELPFTIITINKENK